MCQFSSPTVIRRVPSSSDREPESRICKGTGDFLVVFFGDAFSPSDLVPLSSNGLFPFINDLSSDVGIDQKARTLRQQVIGLSMAAGIAAYQSQVAALNANWGRWYQVVGWRELPIRIHGDHRMVARMIVSIRDQGVKAHAPE